MDKILNELINKVDAEKSSLIRTKNKRVNKSSIIMILILTNMIAAYLYANYCKECYSRTVATIFIVCDIALFCVYMKHIKYSYNVLYVVGNKKILPCFIHNEAYLITKSTLEGYSEGIDKNFLEAFLHYMEKEDNEKIKISSIIINNIVLATYISILASFLFNHLDAVINHFASSHTTYTISAELKCSTLSAINYYKDGRSYIISDPILEVSQLNSDELFYHICMIIMAAFIIGFTMWFCSTVATDINKGYFKKLTSRQLIYESVQCLILEENHVEKL